MNIWVITVKGNQLKGLKSDQSTLFRHIPTLLQGKDCNFTFPETLTVLENCGSSEENSRCIFANKPKSWS
jgi:hypothetical protein